MKKLITIILSALACACMAIGFTACGGSGGGSGGGYTPSGSAPQDSSVTSPIEVSVTFDANGGAFADGEETFTQEGVAKNSTLTAPISPTRPLYTFAGWAKNKMGTSIWQFGTDTVTENTTLYAVWKQKSGVLFSVDGASIDSTEVFMLVDHTTDSVSLASKVVCSEDSTWKLYYDKLGQTEIPTKIAAGKSGSLANGDNEFYLVVTSMDGVQVNVYTLTVHRSYLTTVSYVDGGNLLKTENVYTGDTFTANYLPEITGYTFEGWTMQSGSAYQPQTVWSSLTLTAKKSANTYTVTYDENGGNELSTESKTVTYDGEYALAKPTRTGYTFNGWYKGSTQITDGQGKGLTAWQYAQDTTVTAKWTINQYAVNARLSDENAGSVTGDGKHNYGKTVTLSATTKSGYTFVGWYNGEEKLTEELKYTFTMPAYAVTYTAKWTYYTLTTKSDNTSAGSVSSYDDTKVTVGDSKTVTATTKSGYTFIGWYNGEEKLTDKLSYTFTMPAENLVYTAKWIPFAVKVEKSINSAGTVSGLPTTAILGQEVTLVAATKSGYTWQGWYNGDTLLTEELEYSLTVGETENTYTAKWTYYTLTTKSNNTSAGSVSLYSDKKITAGTSQTLTATTNAGYTFIGWYNGEEKLTGELSYTFNMPAENVTYTAKWTYYTLTTKSDNTSAGSVSSYSDTKVTAGTSQTIKATTKTGYTFVGWYNGEEKLTSELSYTFTMPMENVTYTAKWIKVTVVSENTSAGTVSTLNSTYKVGDNVTIKATTKTGYTFVGWYNGEEKLTSELSYTFTMSTENVTYTAKWIKVTVVSDNTTAGTVSTLNSTYKVGDSATITATTNEGYTFVGWYNGEEKLTSELSYTFTMPTENVTYTAKWTYYTLTTKSNNTSAGSVSSYDDTKVTVGTSKMITATTKTGYTFIGWYNGEEKLTGELKYSFTMPAENLVYTAKWIPLAVKVEKSINSAGTVSGLPTTAILGQEVTLVATKNSGYTWQGWYNGEKKLTGELSYIFNISAENVTYTAKFVVSEEMANFNFTSTATACAITGIKDKTVTEIIVPDYVTSINKGAFSGCSNLQSISLPFVGGSKKTASNTYQYPFGYIFGTSSYTGGIAATQYYYGSSTSDTTSTTYYIPANLTSVTVTGGNILYGAFWNCSGLTSVTIGNGVTLIGEKAFYNCNSLTSITIPDSVTSIGDEAFNYCDSLTSVTIGNGVTSIAEGAFYNCYTLVEVINKSSLTITAGSEDNGDVGYYAKQVITDEANSNIIEQDDYIFYNDKGSYYLLGYKGTATELVLPNTVNGNTYEIYQCAFINCDSLTSVTIPDSVTEIGYWAFNGCDSLTNIEVEDNNIAYKSIDGNLYNKDGSILIQYAIGKTETSFTIPDSVASIGEYAFFGCDSLTCITIPDSVTSTGGKSFTLSSNLEKIVYEGTMAEWKVISYQTGFVWAGSYKVYCTDGIID